MVQCSCMNISLNRKHVLGIIGIAVLIAAVAFLLPKAFVHGDVPPGEIRNLSAGYLNSEIRLSWDVPKNGGDGVDLHYNVSLIAEGEVSGLTESTTYQGHTFRSVAPGNYTVSVVAENEFGASTEVTAGVVVTAAPDTPTGFTYSSASAETDLIDISWSAPDVAVESYRIYVVSPDRKSTEYTVAGDTYTWMSPSLLPSGEYGVSLVAENNKGDLRSLPTETLHITLGSSSGGGGSIAQVGPQNLTYDSEQAAIGKLSLLWDADLTGLVTSYIVMITQEKTTLVEESLLSSVTTYSTSLEPGTYSVNVVANYGDRLSAASTLTGVVLSNSGGGDIEPVAPQNLAYDKKEATKNTLLLTWDADTTGSIAGYDIVISQNKEQVAGGSVRGGTNQYEEALEAGDYYVLVTAIYKDKTTASSSLETVTLGEAKKDDTKISISKINASLLKDPTSVTITWSTDIASDSLVEYGPGKLFTDAKVTDSKDTTSHEITLTKLFTCTVYNYKVSSSYASATGESEVGYFITNGCVKDSAVTSYSIKDIEISKQDTITLVDGITSLQKGVLNVINPVASDVLSVVFELKQLAVDNTSDFEKSTRKLVNKEIFDIKAYKEVDTRVKTFDQPVQVTLNFIPSELPKGVSTDSLAIWHSSDNGENWEKLDNCSVEVSKEDTGIVVCDTYGFSLFAIFSDEKVSEEVGSDTSESSTKSRSAVSGSSKKIAVNDIVSVKASSPATFTFSRDLYYGLRSSEIKTLQQTLNSLGFFVSTYGAGSVGNETNYYGEKTKQAVARFQEAHLSEILTPYGFTKGTGRVGPYTRALLNTLLSK